MTVAEKRHYVPKLYFRGWTSDEKVVPYNLENREEYPRTSISNLAYENDFYNDAVEDALARLETEYGVVLGKIREERAINHLTPEELNILRSFITLQHTRTKKMRILSGDLLEYSIDYVVPDHIDDEKREQRIERLKRGFKDKNPELHYDMMLRGITGFWLINDLQMGLVQNRSEKSFMFSDDPVVLDNPIYKNRYNIKHQGVQIQGLMIYLPLSSDLLLLLFDPNCYLIKTHNEEFITQSTSDRTIHVTDHSEIQRLNAMQFINARTTLFYVESGREEEIQQIQSRYAEERSEEEYETTTQSGGEGTSDPILLERHANFSPNPSFAYHKSDAEYDESFRKPQTWRVHRELIHELSPPTQLTSADKLADTVDILISGQGSISF